MIVNVHEAKTHLSRLIDRAAAGEEIVIGRAGKPVARLMPLGTKSPRIFGALAGQLWMSDNFDEVDEELIDLFEGRGDDHSVA
ncbi:MAG: type II toxin-antitoxin system Phd/YefM family antitoxin [Actinobacteria bacterium]|nr:type II toxin-antitoxin system Phd/YefM family antitoxin [Actinomycetota bacterium]